MIWCFLGHERGEKEKFEEREERRAGVPRGSDQSPLGEGDSGLGRDNKGPDASPHRLFGKDRLRPDTGPEISININPHDLIFS